MSRMGQRFLDMQECVSSNHELPFDELVLLVQKRFKLSDADAEEFVGREVEFKGDYDRFSHGVNDMSDDAEALASAGFGTDEDYGGYDNEPF